MKTRAVVRDMCTYMRQVNPRMAAALIGGQGGRVRMRGRSCRAQVRLACPPACLPFLCTLGQLDCLNEHTLGPAPALTGAAPPFHTTGCVQMSATSTWWVS